MTYKPPSGLDYTFAAERDLDISELIDFTVSVAHNDRLDDESYIYSTEDELYDKVYALLEEGYDETIVLNLLTTSLGLSANDSKCFAHAAQTMLSFIPNPAMDAMAKRWCYDPSKFPKLPESGKNLVSLAGDTVRDLKMSKKKDGLFNQGLKQCYTYMNKTMECLPNSIADLLSFRQSKPFWVNNMFSLLQALYPILDGGLQECIANKTISSKTWMVAIFTHFAAKCKDCSIFMATADAGRLLPQVIDILEEDWPVIVCLGVLLHQLEILQNPAITHKLYEIHRDPSKTANEFAALRKELEKAKLDANKLSKKLSSVDSEAKQLRRRLAMTPQSTKDTSGIIERQQQTIRDLNEEIARLRSVVEQMEQQTAETEHQLYLKEDVTSEDKPWMDLELPDTNVLFVGGNPNNNKKWKNLYPKWSFISTENPNASLPAKVDVIFLCVDHKVSHPLWYRINEIYHNRSKMCYVQSTNLDRLNEEMHYEYWKLLNSRA